jgi:16S rRNA (adenine1518-N6/adenine1519-N6)-dimethyltransferase
MRLEALPPLRQAIADAGIGADKRFGQHFLFDLNICHRIVRLAGPLASHAVIEVGPGPGGLTRALLAAGAKVVAVEKDSRFGPVLADLAAASGGRLTVIHADALGVDATTLPGAPTVIVANLPYNVATPLLVKWLTGPFRPAVMVLMFQREVAQRIVAAPGGGDYGRLAVLAQAVCEARILMELPARAFTPPPKVASAVVRLTPLPDRPSDALIASLQSIAKAAFGQRRKMLRSSLRDLGGETLCARAGIDPRVRAETVPVAGFLALARAAQTHPG